jgi:8-oxo-dGTP diphosphatase
MKTVVVTAAVVEQDDRFLVTRRQEGVHLAGYWEFPGGKCTDDETLAPCLARELREELDVEASVGSEIFVVTHDYPDRRVELHFLKCTIHGEPVPQQGQDLRWVSREELGGLEFPPADAALIGMLRSAATNR